VRALKPPWSRAERIGLVVERVRDRAIVRLRAEEEAVDPTALDVFDALDPRRGEVFELRALRLPRFADVVRAERVADQILALDRAAVRQLASATMIVLLQVKRGSPLVLWMTRTTPRSRSDKSSGAPMAASTSPVCSAASMLQVARPDAGLLYKMII
jgi:hypothetical protein